jgi:hypothetical protein
MHSSSIVVVHFFSEIFSVEEPLCRLVGCHNSAEVPEPRVAKSVVEGQDNYLKIRVNSTKKRRVGVAHRGPSQLAMVPPIRLEIHASALPIRAVLTPHSSSPSACHTLTLYKAVRPCRWYPKFDLLFAIMVS